MKFSLLSVVMLSVGGVLIYSGIKAYDPRDVVKWGLGGPVPKSFLPTKVDVTIPDNHSTTPGGTLEDKQPDNTVPA